MTSCLQAQETELKATFCHLTNQNTLAVFAVSNSLATEIAFYPVADPKVHLGGTEVRRNGIWTNVSPGGCAFHVTPYILWPRSNMTFVATVPSNETWRAVFCGVSETNIVCFRGVAK